MTNTHVFIIAFAVLFDFMLLSVFDDAKDLQNDFQAYQSRSLLPEDYQPEAKP